MPKGKPTGLGNLVFAIPAFALGAWLILNAIKKEETPAMQLGTGAAFVILGVVLGAPGGSSAFHQVKGLLPGQKSEASPAPAQ